VKAFSEWAFEKSCHFSRISGKGAMQEKGYDWSLIGGHIHYFIGYWNQWPKLWWPWTAIMHSCIIHMSYSTSTQI